MIAGGWSQQGWVYAPQGLLTYDGVVEVQYASVVDSMKDPCCDGATEAIREMILKDTKATCLIYFVFF